MWQVLHKPWLSHRRFFCLPRGVVGAGHGRGNPLNRRRHRSLGAGGEVFSTQKVEKAGRRRFFCETPSSHESGYVSFGRKKTLRAPVLEGLGNWF